MKLWLHTSTKNSIQITPNNSAVESDVSALLSAALST